VRYKALFFRDPTDPISGVDVSLSPPGSRTFPRHILATDVSLQINPTYPTSPASYLDKSKFFPDWGHPLLFPPFHFLHSLPFPSMFGTLISEDVCGNLKFGHRSSGASSSSTDVMDLPEFPHVTDVRENHCHGQPSARPALRS